LKGKSFMDESHKKKIATETFKAGLGAISEVSQYAAKGMNDPKAIQATKLIGDSLKNTGHTAKLGADAVNWAVGGVTALAGSGAVAGTGALAALTPFLPAAAVVGVTGIAAYGLYKICEDFLDS
jgi:hypothetical protein